ncbi:hypothetical protein Vadar_021713 [Vaccinium darrowii]|uniref:Uncharacterized protein n=1 Tax=Vaccinium darrowii TaxID=229202 RepID=A0ACB7Y8P9_9ERIC|nr:hypothetical protein Vadar_021713 [Vaccinium darrowii]
MKHKSPKKFDPRVTFEPPVQVEPITIEDPDVDIDDSVDSPHEVLLLPLPGFPPEVPPRQAAPQIRKRKKAQLQDDENEKKKHRKTSTRIKKIEVTEDEDKDEDTEEEERQFRERRTKRRNEPGFTTQKEQEIQDEDKDEEVERRTKTKRNEPRLTRQKNQEMQEQEKEKEEEKEEQDQFREGRSKKRNEPRLTRHKKQQKQEEVEEEVEEEEEDQFRERRSKKRNEPRLTRKKKEELEEEEEEGDVVVTGSKKGNDPPVKRQKKEDQEKEKEQDEEEDDVTVIDFKPARVQYRSTLASIVSVLHDVTFTQGQIVEIQKSPFAAMLITITQQNLPEQFVKKYDNDILSVIQRYRMDEGKFYMGTKLEALTHEEIALIFGIISGNTKIRALNLNKKPDSPFVNRNFEGTSVMSYATMRERITDLIKITSKGKKKKGVEDESTKDLARLLTLYVLGTVFFKTTGPNFNWSYVPFVENWEECTTFAWSIHLTDHLNNELDTKRRTPWTVGGCTVALLYWLCEHAKIMEPVEPQIPRFMKWNVNELHAKLVETPVNTFSPEMVIDSQLQPTDEERRLYQILVTDETEEKHAEIPVYKPPVDEQAPKEDVQLLISELQKQIHLLESEKNSMKHEIAEREIRERQKDNNIGRLLHLVDKLRRRLERYGKEAAAYEEIEKENMSAKFETMVLQEKVVQAEVEVMTLLAEKDHDKENIEAVLDELDDMAAHCVSQEFSHKKIVEDITNENVNLNVEIGSMLIDKDLTEEKIEEVIDQLDDMAAHCASQEYKDKKKIEEIEEKMQKISEKVVERNVGEEFASPTGIPHQIVTEEDSESSPGNPYEFRMATDEDIEKTITAAVSIIDKQEENEMKKKRLRAERVVEPSSLTKRVRERDDRVEKKKEDFFYERRRKRAQQAKAAQVENNSLRFETTTLDAFLSQEDKEKLNMLSNLLKDKKLPFWMDHDTQDAVSLEDAIGILNEGDVENTLLDGFTSILAADEQKPINTVCFKSVLWSLLKDEKNQIRDLFLDKKLREVNEKLDVFYYLVFPINSSGGRVCFQFHAKAKHPETEPSFRLLKSTSETIFGAKEKNEVVIVSEKTPQQKRGSVDCGIIVCYIIQKLLNAEPIPDNLSEVEINEFRVALVRRFLNDGHRSITLEVWKDRQELEQMQQKVPPEGDPREADK